MVERCRNRVAGAAREACRSKADQAWEQTMLRCEATTGRAERAPIPGAPGDGETELVLSWGSRMRPHIPHKSLLGVIPASGGQPAPGDIIVVREEGRSAPQRVVAARGAQGPWLCMADNEAVPCEVGPGALRGTVAWRCWKGHRRSLVVRQGPALELFLAVRRLEARIVAGGRATPAVSRPGPLGMACLAALAVPRRLLRSRLHGADEGDPGRRESPYLVHTLTAALFPVAGPLLPPPVGLDWDAALSLALDHGIAALVGPLWAGLPPAERPPDRVIAGLAAADRRSAATWEGSLEVLRAVVPALRERGIPALLLKGPAVAWSCYRRPLDRTFGDLDLLVPAPLREAAIAALEQCGYRAKLGALGKGLLARGHFHIVLFNPARPAPPIELHWALFDRANLLRIDDDDLFRAARTLDLPGVRVGTLSRVDELIYLCLHLYRHGLLDTMTVGTAAEPHRIALPETGNRLIWFVDLLGFLDGGGGIGSGELWDRARRWNAEEEVERCLLLLKRLFPAAGVDALLAGRAGARGRSHAISPARRSFPAWVMRPLPGLVVRPVRLLELARLFFPSAEKLRAFAGVSSPAGILGARLMHPARMARRIFLGK